MGHIQVNRSLIDLDTEMLLGESFFWTKLLEKVDKITLIFLQDLSEICTFHSKKEVKYFIKYVLSYPADDLRA